MQQAPLWVFILGMAMSVVIILFGIARIRKVYKIRHGQDDDRK